jgi:2-dehydropantoate 2-reductase
VVELDAAPRLQELRGWLVQAGFHVKESDDVDGLAWGKLAVNAGINPVTALTRARNGIVAHEAEARWLMEQAVSEVMAVAEALGIKLPQADPVAATLEVARRTADNKSSMLQDLTRGAPTEIDAICGAVMEHGRRHQVDTPINELFWHLIRAAAAAGELGI